MFNAITKKEYQGKNFERLAIAANENNFQTNAWLTFCQARENGLKIKKGSKATPILCVFNGEEKNIRNNRVRYAYVFNLDQVEKVQNVGA